MRGIHRWPVNSPHKGPVTRKMFPFDDVIMHWIPVFDRSHIIYILNPCKYKRDMYLLELLQLSQQMKLYWARKYTMDTFNSPPMHSLSGMIMMGIGISWHHGMICNTNPIYISVQFLMWSLKCSYEQNAKPSRFLVHNLQRMCNKRRQINSGPLLT